MARSFSQEPRSDSHKIGETRYRMSHLPSTTAIARTLLLAGILLVVTVLAARTFLPAFAQELDEIEFNENSTSSVAVYTATDPEGEDIVWSLLDADLTDDGTVLADVDDYPDHDVFSISGGVLSFKSAPDYENPQDSNADNQMNVYNVMVLAIAGDEGNTTTAMQPVRVTVINLDEPGNLTLSTAHPKVSVEITATLTDPDGKRNAELPVTPENTNFDTITDVSTSAQTQWRWATSTSDGMTWNDIPSATTNTYTPGEKDEGVLLRVTAVYMDGHGKDDPFTDEVNELEHTLRMPAANAVLPLDYTNRPPKFPDQDPDTPGDQTAQTREVSEDAAAGATLGDPVSASDKDADNDDEKLFYRLEDTAGIVLVDHPFVIDNETAQISVSDDAELDYDAGEKEYVVLVRATDPGSLFATTSVTIKVTDVDEDPEMGDADAGTENDPSDDENLTVKTFLEVTAATADTYSRFVSTYEATDQEDAGTELTWSLTDADRGYFTLYEDNTCASEATTGVGSVSLCFKQPIDYENSSTLDSGRNHVYDVQVNVQDSGGNTDSRDVAVTIENVQEGRTLSIRNLQPQASTQIVADLHDPDNYETSREWQWATSTQSTLVNDNTQPIPWNPIDTSDAKDDSDYTPRDRDAATTTQSNVYLWVEVSYTDNVGLAQKVYAVSANIIKPRDDSNTDPVFVDDSPSVTMPEDLTGPVNNTRLVTELEVADDSDMILVSDSEDILTFTILDNNDSESFELGTISQASGVDDATVQLMLVAGTELDADTKDKYTVTVRATDPSNRSDDATVTLNVTGINESPEFTSPEFTGGTHSVNFTENSTMVAETFVAKDPEGSSIEWTLSGDHADAFTIAGGELEFKNAPDFESPTFVDDQGDTITVTNNDYDVTVSAGDGSTTAVTVDLTVNVTNEEEDGTLEVDTFLPKVETPITATLVDDDIVGAASNQDWEWATSTKASGGTWNAIDSTLVTDGDANSRSTYTPRTSDAGMYLRVRVEYNDGNLRDDPNTDPSDDLTDKAEPHVFEGVVLARDYTNQPPKFPDQDSDTPGVQNATTTRKIKEDASPNDVVGAVVTAEDLGSDGETHEQLFYRLYDADNTAVASDRPASFAPNVGVDDDAFFVIDSSSGQIRVDSDEELNFETQEEYRVAVTATDPGGLTDLPIFVTIKVLNVNESPEFGDEDRADDENLTSARYKEKTGTTTAVSSYTATDDENGDEGTNGQVLKWSLSGNDAEHFSICKEDMTDAACTTPDAYRDSDGPVPVYLRFKESPNFEAQADSNSDNVYNVTVEATDNDGNRAARMVAITLVNEDDLGKVSLSSIQPEAGSEIRAVLTDPDDGVTGVTWQWKYSEQRSGQTANYQDIIGATSDSYVPTSGDAARQTFLRAVATYSDAQGQDKVATSSPSNKRVDPQDMDNLAPAFPDQDPNTQGTQKGQTRYVLEETEEAPVVVNKDGSDTDTDPDPDHVTAAIDTDDNPGTAVDRKLTYTLTGTNAGLFNIASTTAEVSLRSGMKVDFEAGDTYTVTITATDPSLESDTMTLTIKVVKVDEKPTFSKKGLSVQGPATDSYPENESRDVATFMARGSEAPGADWSLEGNDAGDFQISSSGVLTFRSTPNFEAPTDSDTNNVYNVTVKASSDNISDTMSVTITVTNVDEPGSVSISSTGNEVKVGVQLTAELDERDEETNVTWQWASSSSNTGPWDDITGETNNTYTPVEGDVGNYLRVTASYTDASFGPDSEEAITDDAVEAASTAGTPGTLALSPTTQLTSGDTVTATLTDADNPTNQAWQWARSSTASGTFTTISNATSASYTTTDDDAGNYLRASVTYTDDSGAGQTAGPVATTDRVRIHGYDADADGRINRSEVIQAIRDFLVEHSISRAEVIEVIRLYLTIR